MNEERKMKKSTKYLLIGTLVLFLSILGASMAYYLARVQGTLNGRVAGTELAINVQKISSNATGDLIPLDNDLETLGLAAKGYQDKGACVDINGYSVCQIYHITLTNNGTVPLDITGGVQLVGANTPNIDCAVMDNDTEVTSNNSCKGANTLADNDTLNAGASEDYYVLVYINNLDEPQCDKGEFVGTVSFTSTQGKRVKGRFNDTYNAAAFIKDKFDSDESKTTVDAADGVQYKYATTEHLMYDRLGGTTTELEEGNLRYYGASPANYIDIGDKTEVAKGNWEVIPGAPFSDRNGCLEWMATTVEEIASIMLERTGYNSADELCTVSPAGKPILWRIIGIFDGNLKIVRDESIGLYSWDTSASNVNNGYGINEWRQADLMKLLNPGYESEQDGGSLWWNSQSGNCYKNSNNFANQCDFSNVGLSNDTKDLVVENLWYLGGVNSNTQLDSFASQYYAFERGNNVFQNPRDGITRTTKWTGKVGLIYPSDYGYATDLSNCRENLHNYSNSTCGDNDWLKTDYLLTISPISSGDNYSLYIDENGMIDDGYNSDELVVRPVLYFKKDVVIESGTGTKDDPYIAG